MKSELENICYDIDKEELEYHAISPEIVMTSSFYYDDIKSFNSANEGSEKSYTYTRGGNPTNFRLEKKLRDLEGGEMCTVFASGMGAITATLFSLLQKGDHVLVVNTIYSTALSYLQDLSRFGISVDVINTCDDTKISEAIKENTSIIYFESPSTQKFEMVDLKKISAIAKERNIKTIIDNTWATPLFQRPIESGIDIVIHSCSKYIGGHTDIVGGAVIGTEKDITKIIAIGSIFQGATLSPFNAFLALRGLRTLPLRMKQHSENIKDVIDFLENDPRIEAIYHPYARQRELSKKYLEGYGSLMAVTFTDKDVLKLEKFVNALDKFIIGVSWGGYESMVLPVYRGNNEATLKQRGLDITHTRLFVGLSDSTVLISDLKKALDSAYK